MASGSHDRQMVLLGTGTSVGVPVIGCDCEVCQSTNPKNHRTRTGVLVHAPGGDFVIDTPPELRLQLLSQKVQVIQAAVYTHGHADHIFGLDDLRICGHRLDRAVDLYCEEIVEERLRLSFSYAFDSLNTGAHSFAIPRLSFVRIGLSPFDVLGQTLLPIRLLHGKLPILGFRLNDVAFCTDVSHIPEESLLLLEGLDVLVLDGLRETPHPTHLSIPQALEIVERLKPKQAYLTHIAHSVEHEATNARLPDGVELAYDGLRIAF